MVRTWADLLELMSWAVPTLGNQLMVRMWAGSLEAKLWAVSTSGDRLMARRGLICIEAKVVGCVDAVCIVVYEPHPNFLKTVFLRY